MVDQNLLPLSVCICTLDSDKYITTCLHAVSTCLPQSIFIVDASSDSTIYKDLERANKNLTVLRCEPRGLAYQRQYVLKHIRTQYLAYVDCQDVLHTECLKILLSQLQENQWHAIQASTLSYDSTTYWQRAYDSVTTNSINKVGPTTMVGRPCIYLTSSIRLVGFDPYFGPGIGCEDVDISIQFEMLGFPQGKGTGITYRQHPSTFLEWFSKWQKYGRGDACIVTKYPHKLKNIIIHQLVSYPIMRPLENITTSWRYLPFYLLFGYVRFISMCLFLITNSLFKSTED